MRQKIAEAVSSLKDFQLKTAEYVFDQLYNKNRHKMLVADEVGLGKTVVAKGIIAKAFERYLEQGGPTKENPTFNVVYICSNLSLAKQNLAKLNFLKDEKYIDDIISRLTYLAYKPAEKPKIFSINALTPGTSFELKNGHGSSEERAIIYNLLSSYSPFYNRKNGLKWLLKGNKNKENWEYDIKRFSENSIRPDLRNRFRQELLDIVVNEESFPRLLDFLNTKSELTFWHAIHRTCDLINGKNAHLYVFQGEVIGHLRWELSKLCLKYLNADIYILDEFQRYSNLIKMDNFNYDPAVELAKEVFKKDDAKILMLSATPFKPYTNEFDELNGEIHHKEFETVLKFLMRDEANGFWEQYKNDRKKFFEFLRKPEELQNNFTGAYTTKANLEQVYRNGIVRTERLLVVDNNDLISSKLRDECLDFRLEDIDDFVNLDKIVQLLNEKYSLKLPVTLEYVKSGPFTLSYLDDYYHKNEIEDKLDHDDPELKDLLRKNGKQLD